MPTGQWEVDFIVFTTDYSSKYSHMKGTLTVTAKDIFEALQLTKDKIRTFGFEHHTILEARALMKEMDDKNGVL